MIATASITEPKIGWMRKEQADARIDVGFSVDDASGGHRLGGEHRAQEGAMDNGKLHTLIESLSQDIEGEPGYWSFTLASLQVVVITHEA